MAASTVNSAGLASSCPCCGWGCAHASTAPKTPSRRIGRIKKLPCSPIVNGSALLFPLPAAHTSSSLFPDTEGRKDAIENVVGRGGPGDGVDRPQSGIKVQEQHLVWNAQFGGFPGLLERFHALAQQLLVPQAGNKTGFLLAR